MATTVDLLRATDHGEAPADSQARTLITNFHAFELREKVAGRQTATCLICLALLRRCGE